MTLVKSTLETLLSEIKADVNVKENKGGKSKDSIYKLSGLTTDEMKKSRNQIRSKFDKLASSALSALKRENGIKEDTKEGIKNFISYYKEKCVLNDFSLKSICADNRNEADKKMLQRMLELCKLHLTK